VRFRLWQADTYAVSSRFAACCRYGFINDYAWLAGLSTITGGAGADQLTGGAGDDDFVYTAFAQGGNVVAGNDTATDLTAGDIITDFATTADEIDISAVASGTAAVVGGGGGDTFDSATDGVGIVTVDYDFSAASKAGNVIDAIIAGFNTSVTIDDGDTAYFAILDEDGGTAANDFYNIFAITNGSGGDLAGADLKDADVDVTLVASTAAGDVVVGGDFILA